MNEAIEYNLLYRAIFYLSLLLKVFQMLFKLTQLNLCVSKLTQSVTYSGIDPSSQLGKVLNL